MTKLEKEANRVQWLQHVSAWRKSGLTQSGYCRQHGLNVALLSAWVVRVKKAPVELAQSVPTIVPLKVEPEVATGTSGDVSIVLQHKSGWQLRLACDTPVVWLGSLLSQLA